MEDKSTVATIGYEGKLNVYIKHGKTVIDHRSYHNAGTDQLFKFLCCCIQGDWDAAKELKPYKIRLYHNRNAWSSNVTPDLNYPVSGFIPMNKYPTLDPSENKVKVSLHFLVPYSNVLSTGEEDAVNQVCLYSVGANETTAEKYLAYYFFAKEDDTG